MDFFHEPTTHDHRRPGEWKLAGSAGFTLVELLVTMAVAGILLAIGMPSMTSFLANRAALANADEFADTLRFARSEAIKRSGQVQVCPTLNPNAEAPTCATAADWKSGWIVTSVSGRVLRVQNAVRSMDSIENGPAAITFEATGIASTGAECLIFKPVGYSDSSPDSSRRVDMTILGHVQISKGNSCAA
jgi:type IV fimbrial biogenesis protein FimT